MSVPSTVINQLVSIAEYSTTNWKQTVNLIENIDDGRGYTIGLVGFCTGTGDFLELLLYLQKLNPLHVLIAFIPIIQHILHSNHPDSTLGLEKLPSMLRKIGKNDTDFWKATWHMVKKLYWEPALEFCDHYELKSELARYIVYDTMLNFGDLKAFRGMKKEDEELFLRRFLVIKQHEIEEDSSLGDPDHNRVDMQMRLLKKKNFDLDTPMRVNCYGDTYVVL